MVTWLRSWWAVEMDGFSLGVHYHGNLVHVSGDSKTHLFVFKETLQLPETFQQQFGSGEDNFILSFDDIL